MPKKIQYKRFSMQNDQPSCYGYCWHIQFTKKIVPTEILTDNIPLRLGYAYT